MSRDWLAVYVSVLGRPKYRRLSIPGRAALFHVWMLAGGQAPEATWTSRAELADVLDLDGFPPEVLGELVARRWLDEDEAGRVTVHDWDEHQLAATLAARRAYEADRKRDWRRRPAPAEPLSPAPLSRDTTPQDNTGQVSRIVRDTSGTIVTPRPPEGRCVVCDAVTPDAGPDVCMTPRGVVHGGCLEAYRAGAVAVSA